VPSLTDALGQSRSAGKGACAQHLRSAGFHPSLVNAFALRIITMAVTIRSHEHKLMV
jgi:hypothetical protein